MVAFTFTIHISFIGGTCFSLEGTGTRASPNPSPNKDSNDGARGAAAEATKTNAQPSGLAPQNFSAKNDPFIALKRFLFGAKKFFYAR